VTRRRLERAFVELADRPAQRGVVQAVALSYGFADLNHFSRLFKGQFGVPPSDVLALGGRTADLRAAEHGPAQPLDRTVRRLVRIIGGSPFG
jgi:AraC-like DNA-binding protein